MTKKLTLGQKEAVAILENSIAAAKELHEASVEISLQAAETVVQVIEYLEG